jgi:hypothetical protein
VEDFGNNELASDSTPSPNSPLSPTLANTYALPGDDWMAWDKIETSPQPDDFLKTEPFEDAILASIPSRSISISPAINPMDLANPTSELVTLGQEGINDNQPLFLDSKPVQLSMPTPRSQRSGAVKLPTPGKTSTSTSPEPLMQKAASSQGAKRYPSRSLKRKSSTCDSEDDDGSQRSSISPPPALRRSSTKDSGKEQAPKKTAHNMIEKRYRTNLNDKIAALRDSVPALRVMVHKLEHQGSDDEGDDDIMGAALMQRGPHDEDLGGLEPAHKLNKATILSKATEYIAHLERKNRSLAKENGNLRGKVEGFEMLMMSRGPARPIWT